MYKTDWKLQTGPGVADWKGVLGGVLIGTVLGVGGALFHFNGRLSAVEQRSADDAAQRQIKARPTGLTESPGEPRDQVSPELLSQIIEEQQRLHVKESSGEGASQSFTQDDLQQFLLDRCLTRSPID